MGKLDPYEKTPSEKGSRETMIKRKTAMLLEKANTLTCLKNHLNKYNEKGHELKSNVSNV